ncbi:MAG: hypothetical protein FWD52_05380 [Candidatus Bathyarchaeota archaeon]|nr:hypothetical protein [Candidatus Termiticorpusculum sp.]
MRKCTVLALIAVLTASILMVHTVAPVSAQAGYKPLVPQVIVKLGGNAYEVSASTETVTDPFTGENYTITHPGYRVADWSFEFTVKNQPFTRYTDADGKKYYLMYVVEFKNHLEGRQGWKAFTRFFQYETQYTTTTHGVICKYNPSPIKDINSLPDGTKLDFRVKAETAYGKTVYDPDSISAPPWTVDVPVASSGWSDVPTITLSFETTSTSPPFQTATLPPVTSNGDGQPQFPGQTHPPNSILSNPFFMFVVSALFAGVVIAVVLVILRRHLKTPTYTNDSLYQTSEVEGLYA